MRKTSWRFSAAVLFALATVAVPAWVGAATSKGSTQTGAYIVLAITSLAAQFFLPWMHRRMTARERAAAVSELRPPNNPSGLLRADQHIVPFTGRTREFDELREWCRDDKPPVRLIVGPGGVGKTRLALHLGDYLKAAGWSVTVVATGKEVEAVAALTNAAKRSSIFLIVDYAEARAGLVELLRAVAERPARVRALLIARSAGDWWNQLGSDAHAVRELVNAYPPLRLSNRVDPVTNPTELIRAAVPHFADALGFPTPTKIETTAPEGESPLLALHATALLAVLRSRELLGPTGKPGEKVVPTVTNVLTELISHERRFWTYSAERAGLGLDSEALQRAVATMCLFGAVSESDGAETLHRVPDLRGDEGLRRRVARWLARIYPGDRDYWGTLQPELVAETHVIAQLQRCPELITAELSGLRPEQVRRMLTVLSLGATHQPTGLAHLEQVLRADIERMVPLALEVAAKSGGAMGQALAEVFADAPLTAVTLREIEEAIPYPTTALADAAVAVTRRIVDILPPDADPAQIAHWHSRLALVLAQAGRADEARTYIEMTIDSYQNLIKNDRGRYLPDLARSLQSLGVRLSEQGHYVEALPHTERAIGYYRELVGHDPGCLADLAASLSNLGLWLAESGRDAEALPPLHEAVEYYLELAESDPDRHRRDLAQALTNLRQSESRVPVQVEPVSLLESMVNRNRGLVEIDPDRHLPELARSLYNLGNGYAEQDRREDAVPQLTEALDYYRSLAERHDQYRPEQAACLNNLGVYLAELGRYADALPYAWQAVELNRDLTETSPIRYQRELARSLDNLVSCLSRMGRHHEARQPAEEAVRLYRRLVEVDPRYRAELAQALRNLGVSLSELRQHALALPDSREAVAIYQDLYQDQPEEYADRLADALRSLAVDFSGLGRHAEADRCVQEAGELSAAAAA